MLAPAPVASALGRRYRQRRSDCYSSASKRMKCSTARLKRLSIAIVSAQSQVRATHRNGELSAKQTEGRPEL